MSAKFVLTNISFMYTEHWNLSTLYHIHAQITNINTHKLCFNPKPQKMYLQK